MNEHKIGIISDTHGVIRTEVLDALKSCEYVFHAGDIGNIDILSKFKENSVVYAVRGNIDKNLPKDIPDEISTELFGFKIYMIHNKSHIHSDLTDKDIVIYGHSHKYCISVKGNTAYINPGSCGVRRFHLPVSMIILKLYPEEHRFEIERIDLMSETNSKNILNEVSVKDMDILIRAIIKDIKSDTAVEKIAEKNHIDYELAEQICRIYFTHPGIDTEGILKRMEIKNL